MKIWGRRQDKKIKSVIREEEGGRLFIEGDFNARIGNECHMYVQETMEEEIEKYKDKRSKDGVKNGEGECLLRLLEDRGWHVANGNVAGDEEGEFTYVGARGATVTDYVILSTESVGEVGRFEVGDRTESDHQPLCLYWKGSMIRRRDREERKKKKVIKWEVESIQRFKEETREMKYDKEEIQDAWKELEDKVRGCLDTKEVVWKEEELRKHEWWDKQCRSEKRNVRRSYRRWRKGRIAREEYLEMKKSFKRTCKEKREKRREEMIEEIRNVRTEAQLWRYINNNRRKRREEVGRNISREEWKVHFMVKGEGREHITEEEDEEEIKEEEIEEQIRRLKARKATGIERGNRPLTQEGRHRTHG